MPRDRLAELQDGRELLQTSPLDTVTVDIGDGPAMANLEGFFKEVDDIKIGIANVKKKVVEIEQLHSKTLSAVGEQGDHGKQLDALMDSANADISKVRNKVKAMEASNKKAGADASKADLSAEQRIRLSQYASLTKKFIEAVQEYQDIQSKYKNKFRDRLARQFKIVKPNATEEEVEKVLEGGGDSSQIFAQSILMGPQHAEAKKALYDIQERHQDIVKLEKSILELHQLFLDMAVLVDAQGEMINQIEHYVQSAADHTSKGVDEMKKAVKSQKKSRKRMCCLLVMLIVVVIIVSVIAGVATKH